MPNTFPFFTFYPLLLVLLLVFYEESLARLPMVPIEILEGCYDVTIQPSLLQVEQPQIPQSVFIQEVLQAS